MKFPQHSLAGAGVLTAEAGGKITGVCTSLDNRNKSGGGSPLRMGLTERQVVGKTCSGVKFDHALYV